MFLSYIVHGFFSQHKFRVRTMTLMSIVPVQAVHCFGLWLVWA